jgi:DNA repair protein RadA
MGHASTYRILLRKTGRYRIAIMIDSPYHVYDQTRFTIAEGGVEDVQECKNKSEW